MRNTNRFPLYSVNYTIKTITGVTRVLFDEFNWCLMNLPVVQLKRRCKFTTSGIFLSSRPIYNLSKDILFFKNNCIKKKYTHQ